MTPELPSAHDASDGAARKAEAGGGRTPEDVARAYRSTSIRTQALSAGMANPSRLHADDGSSSPASRLRPRVVHVGSEADHRRSHRARAPAGRVADAAVGSRRARA